MRAANILHLGIKELRSLIRDLDDIIWAHMEGTVLRVRPKLMTVTTIVAGLLPIMWSTSAGSEVMKPLAAPVFGGMLSSLVHVLIVTPVIFYWIRLRELKREEKEKNEG